MKISYFKLFLAASLMLFGSMISIAPAEAQVLVRDVNTRSAVRSADSNITGAVNSGNTARNDFETQTIAPHYETEIEKYDAQIARLEHLIHSLSYHDPAAEPGGVPERDADLYTAMAETNTERQNLIGLSNDESSFGIELSSAEQSNITDFLKRYGFFPGDELYPGNVVLQNLTNDTQSALYYADTLSRDANNSHATRFSVYEDLASRAQNTQDLRAAIEVNNALLIENGRNLALLIQLQTAQLNADASIIRENVRKEHIVPRLFGSQNN